MPSNARMQPHVNLHTNTSVYQISTHLSTHIQVFHMCSRTHLRALKHIHTRARARTHTHENTHAHKHKSTNFLTAYTKTNTNAYSLTNKRENELARTQINALSHMHTH